MSIPVSSFATHSVAPVERAGLYVALIAAHVVSRMKPAVLHKSLKRYANVVDATGNRTAKASLAEHAHAALCRISPRCASHDACFVRSIALYLYLRPRACNVSWHAGFRTDPFLAHAWIEVGGQPVSEAIDTSLMVETMRAG